jgi:hypothetical protein
VYHIDYHGKQQGVVFQEMAARENTEADLLDHHIRQSIYDTSNPYAMECGGRTDYIQKLTNAQIMEYHLKFYQIENCTILIIGPANIKNVLNSLENYVLPTIARGPSNLEFFSPTYPDSADSFSSKTVQFPSETTDVGSIAYGWKGPNSDDYEDIFSLEILFRLMNDNPSSLLPQRFTEIPDPWATDIDFEIKSFLDCPIILTFSGVPILENSPTESSQSDFSEASDSTDDSENNGSATHDLFERDYFYQNLMEAFHYFYENTLLESGELLKCIHRHRKKILEAIEESPHETLMANILPDVIRYHFISRYNPVKLDLIRMKHQDLVAV